MSVKDKSGEILLDFIRCKEDDWKDYNPTLALIVAKYKGKDLLMFNKWRKHWEVPGGFLEPNESLRECAIRELLEETNQTVDSIKFIGMMKFQMMPDNRIEYGGLYAGNIEEYKEFVENEEAAEIVFWDKVEDIGYVNEINEKLLDYCE